jgi:hypothetical protein
MISINFGLWMDEWKTMQTLNSLMDEWNHATLGLSMDE